MLTTMRPFNYYPTEDLNIIIGNCTPILRISQTAYKVSDLDTLVILADEYEELEP